MTRGLTNTPLLANAENRITLRGISIGALMSVIIAIGAPYCRQVIQGTSLALTSATPAAFFLLFVLLLTIHILLCLGHHSWGLKRGELITIFFMMMISSAIPTKGVVGLLLPMITGTYYYATPENNWANLVHPYLPHWLIVDNFEAIKSFYEGGPGDSAVPWASWLPPLFAWLLFYLAFYLTQTSIMVILRRQWVEHERLAYPLMQVPLAMIADHGKPSLVKPFFRNSIMWLGFSIPFILMSIYALAHYSPLFPALQFKSQIDLFQQTIQLIFGINFLMMGFAYFINANVAFSLWFFYLAHKIQEGVMVHLGMETAQAELGWWTEPGMGHQMMGALISLTLATLWTARAHLKNVWRKAYNADTSIDDTSEIMSYRSAILGAVIGLVIMWGWLWKTGIPFWLVAVFIVVGLTIFISLARIIAETGLPIIKPTMIPAGFVLSNIGTPALGIKGIIATGYTMVWCGDLLVFMMAPLAHGLRLSSDTQNNRRLFGAIAAAMVITLVVSVWYTITLAYQHGSMNLLISDHYAMEPSRLAAEKLSNPTGPNITGYLRMGIGALFMGFLIVMRQQFLWWPFHPLGFVVSHGRVMDGIWFTIFLAWLVKSAILTYGGVRFYRTLQPFFLGLALGHIVVGGIWLVIDGFTGMIGNRIHLYS